MLYIYIGIAHYNRRKTGDRSLLNEKLIKNILKKFSYNIKTEAEEVEGPYSI